MAKAPMSAPKGPTKPSVQTPQDIASPSKPASGGSDTNPYSSARKASRPAGK